MAEWITRLFPVPPNEFFGIAMPKGARILSCIVVRNETDTPHMTVLWDKSRNEDREVREFALMPLDDPFELPEGKEPKYVASFYAYEKHFNLFEVVPESLRNFTLVRPSPN